MRSALLCSALSLSIGLASLFTASAAAEDWIRAETRHFLIYSNVGQSATREYLEQLEGFKYLSELLLGADPKSAPSSARFTVYLLDEREQLKTVRPDFHEYVAGVYLHCVEGAQAYAHRPLSTMGGQDTGLMILLHEYAHHVMFSRLRRFYPSWYVEGFADYLSTVTLRGGVYRVGGGHNERLTRLSDDAIWIDFSVMLDQKRLAEANEARRINSLQFYAQAWLLTHYMLSDSERTQAFNRYFELIGQGEDALTSFESVTGIEPAQLTRVLRSYLRKMPGVRITIPALPESAITITRVPKEQQEYRLTASVLTTCPRPEYAEKLLATMRGMQAKHSADAHFMTELSRAELLFGDAAVARSNLERLALADTAGFDTFYLLGRTYYEAAMDNPEQREVLMKKASREFATAYTLNKSNAPNLHFLARSLDDSGDEPSQSMINAANAAAVFGPSVHEYAINAAVVNLRAEDREAAIRVLRPFASDPHNPTQAARAAAMIAAIREHKDIAAVMAAFAEKPEETGDE